MELTASYFFFLGKLFLTEIWYLKVWSINKESTTTTPHFKKENQLYQKGAKRGRVFLFQCLPKGTGMMNV